VSDQRLEQFELDCYDTADTAFEVPVRAFLRRGGLEHVFDELLRPTMAENSTLVALAVRNRPWPPWGVGARTVSALAIATPVTETTAGITGVLAVPEETTSIALLAGVYRTLLDGLGERGVERVHLVVKEGSSFGERLVAAAGFEPTSNLMLTEDARYWLHDSDLVRHRSALAINDCTVDELVSGEALSGAAFDRCALFLFGVSRALDPWWRELIRAPDIIANTGPGRVAECLPPGGPPKRGADQEAIG
jgi:hypothetical protein